MQQNNTGERIKLEDDVYTPGGTVRSPGGAVRSPARFIPRQGSWGLVDYGHQRLDAHRGGGTSRGGWGTYNSPPSSPQEQPFWPQRGTPPPDFLHHQPFAASRLGAGSGFCHEVQSNQEAKHGVAQGGG